jgi:SNARE protein 1
LRKIEKIGMHEKRNAKTEPPSTTTHGSKKMDDSYNDNNNKNVDVRSMEIEFVRALNAFVNNFHLPTTTTVVETWKTGVKPHVYAESLRRQLNALREKTEKLYAFEEEEEKEEEGEKNFNNRTNNNKKKLKKKRSTLLAAVFVGAREDEDEDDENDEHNDEHYQTDKRNHTKKERDERKFRAYEEKINEIEKKVPAYEHPAFVSATASAIPSSSSSLSSSFSSSSATAALATAAAAKNAAENVDVPVATVTTTTTKKKKLYAPKEFTISKEGDELLQNEKKMQENLTDEMVDLASRIKRNAEEVSRELSRSNKLVDSMETKLDQNVVVAKNATQRQTAVFRKNKKYGCWSCIVLTLIFVLFSWVYIVIKFSGDKTVHLIKKMEDRVRYDNREDDDVVVKVERDEQVSGEAKHSSSGSRDALEL